MADFASLADIKAALEITDTANDAALTALVPAVTSAIIEWLNRDPRPDDFTDRVDGRNTPDLLVNRYPISNVALVTITSWSGNPPPLATTLDLSAIDWNDNMIFRRDGGVFPKGRRNISVTYTAGLDPMPKAFKLAAQYTARAMWTSRRVDLNSSGESWAGVTSNAWNEGTPGVVPLAAQALIRNHRQTVFVP